MLMSVFIALGGLAAVLMVASINAQIDSETQIAFRLLSMIMWFVWAVQAAEVTRVAGSTTVTESYTSLLIIGVVLGGIMALSVVLESFALFEVEVT